MFRLSLLVCVLLVPVTAFAQSAPTVQSDGGWYVSGSIGGYFREDTSFPTTFDKSYDPSIRATGTQRESFDPTVVGNIALGYRVLPELRVEAEIGYLDYTGSTLNPLTNDPRFPRLDGRTFTRQSGDDWSRFTGTVNAFYDLPAVLGFTPYVGAGIGASADHRTSGIYNAPGGATFYTGGGDSTEGLWLLEGGFNIPLTDSLTLAPAYRYIHFFSNDNEDRAHIVKVSLRYAF